MPVIVRRDRTCGLFRAPTSIWYVPFQIHMAFCSSSPFHPFLSGPSFHVTTGGRKTVRCGGPLASTRCGRDSVFLDCCLRFRNNKQFQSISLFTTEEEPREKVCYSSERCSRSNHIWRSVIACIPSVNRRPHNNTRGVQMRVYKPQWCALTKRLLCGFKINRSHLRCWRAHRGRCSVAVVLNERSEARGSTSARYSPPHVATVRSSSWVLR